MKDTHVNKLDSVLTDLPQEDGNFLGTEKYDQGLSRFIEQCSTPMTIAIQGDWGSGKTTTMKLVKGHLEGSFDSQVVKSIEVNTWQYSQMNLDDALVLNLLAEIVSEVEKDVSGIAGNGKATKIVQELMMASGAAAVAAGRTAAGLFLSSGLNDMLQAGWEAGKSRFQKKSETPENINFIKKVSELREEFQRSHCNFC